MNIIDALVVKFSADTKEFVSGMNDAEGSMDKFGEQSNKQTKRVNAQTKNMAAGVRKVRTEIASLLSLSLGAAGMGTLMSRTIGDQSSIGRLSRNLQMSARDLDAWGRVMGKVGGKAEDARQSMQAIATAIEERSLGIQSEAVSALFNLQVRMVDENGKPRAPADILRDVAGSEKFQGASAQRQLLIARRLGISEPMTYLMRQGPQAMTSQLEEARRNSNVTRGSVQASQDAQEALNELNQSLNGVWQTIFITLGPAMDDMADAFEEFGDWLRENRGDIEQFFSSVVTGTQNLVTEFGELNAATDGMAGKITAAAAALVALRMAVVALGAVAGVMMGGRRGGGAGRAGGGLLSKLGMAGISAAMLEPIGKAVEEWATQYEWGRWVNQNVRPFDFGREMWNNAVQSVQDAATRRPELMGNSRAQQAIDFFTSSGWSREQAIGIAANLQRESNFDPRAVGDNGQAYGIAQWHPDRQRRFAEQFGKRIQHSTFQEQLEFINHELLRGREMRAGNSLMNATTAGQAAAIVSREYERPADRQGEAARRAAWARQYSSSMISPAGYASALQVGAGASPAVTNNANRTVNTSSNETRIETINVNTQATDANGIAQGISGGIRSHPLLNWSAMGQY